MSIGRKLPIPGYAIEHPHFAKLLSNQIVMCPDSRFTVLDVRDSVELKNLHRSA